MVDALGTGHQLVTRLQVRILSWLQIIKNMREIFDAEILDRSMWNIYQTMKDDNFQFDWYSIEDKSMMINSILPYFEKIEEYEICQELKNQIKIKKVKLWLKEFIKLGKTYTH